MADPQELMDKTITAILTALIQIILLATVFIPTAIRMISGMTVGLEYQVLMYAVVTIQIVSVLIGIIYTYIERR